MNINIPVAGAVIVELLAVSFAITGSFGGTAKSTCAGLTDIEVAVTPAEFVTLKSILDGTTPALTVPSITELISVLAVNALPLYAVVTIDPT
jgi:hypothetical protein